MLRGFYRVTIGFVDEGSLESVSNDDSVIFMSNHRSNMDYLVMNYLTAERTMLSFGVGEWSGIFPIRQLMRSAGGYFIRRDSGDPLYKRALEKFTKVATNVKVKVTDLIRRGISLDDSIEAARITVNGAPCRVWHAAAGLS